MHERTLTRQVMAAAQGLGLLVHHCPDSRRCEGDKGLPDLIIIGSRGVLFAELKGEDGETSAAQDEWLYALHRSGAPYSVWRPEDWWSGRIIDTLRGMR